MTTYPYKATVMLKQSKYVPSTLTSISSRLPDTLLIVKYELVPTGAEFKAVPLTSGKSPLTLAINGEPIAKIEKSKIRNFSFSRCFGNLSYTWYWFFIEMNANNMIGRFDWYESDSKFGVSLWMNLRRYVRTASADCNL